MPAKNIEKEIQDMKKKGFSNSKIIDSLKKQGFSSQEIYDELSTGEEKTGNDLEAPAPISEEMGSEETPEQEQNQEKEEELNLGIPPISSSPVTQIPSRQGLEQIEEIAESIIEEKWNELNASVGNLNIWREKTSSEIEAIKQEILRIRNSFENLNNTIAGRIQEYHGTISDLGAEIKALNKIFEKIIQPLTTNVKELSRITQRLKK